MEMDTFRVRLNCIDHYQAKPTKYDPKLRKDGHLSRVSEQAKMPVIRVFGSTQTGQKVCAHIHGALPYLFVEYDGNLNHDDGGLYHETLTEDGLTSCTVGAYIYRLHLSIDHALAVSYRRDAYKAQPTFVARITLVKGIPFYGFHVGYCCYLKVYMLNPMVMTRLADLLQQGLIMNRVFQPYEAHLQYLLQFMTDYNLYGCTYIEAGKVAFRSPVPEREEDEESPHIWHSQSIPPDRVTDDYTLPRASHCSIEVDICVQDILNRNAVQERPLHHDFTERLNPISPDMKLVHSMAGLWRDETRRRKRKMGLEDNTSTPFPADVLVPMSADPRDSQPQGWLHEEQYREQIDDIIRQETATMNGKVLDYDDFVDSQAWLDSVNTALQSVEDLYPENLLPALGLDQHRGREGKDPSSSIEVDEDGILEMEMDAAEADDLFPDDSDEEALREAAAVQEAHGGKGRGRSIENPKSIQKPSSSPEQLQDEHHSQLANGKLQTFSGLFEGVCVSGLKSGTPPRIPLSKALIAEARTEGLVTKLKASLPSAVVHGSGSLNTLPEPQKKRVAAALDDGPNTKRKRVTIHGVLDRLALQQPSRYAKHDGAVGQSDEIPTSTPTPLSRGRKVLSTGNTEKSRGNRTLVLPVVKDPNDPSTRLRLSQQSNSQKSQDGFSNKHVTFDPQLPALDNTSSATSATPTKSPAGLALSLSPVLSQTMSSTAVATSTLTKLRWDSATVMFAFSRRPPPADEVLSTMRDFGLPDVIYQDAFYSNENDVPPRPREYAGREYRLESNTLPYLPEFNATGASAQVSGERPEQLYDRARMEEEYESRSRECTWRSWELAIPPPSATEVSEWWAAKQGKQGKRANTIQKPRAPEFYLSQIEGATPKNKHGFKYSQKQKSTGVRHEAQYMSTMSLEVHVNTRGQLYPDPEEDAVQCIFWSLRSDENTCRNSQDGNAPHGLAGILVLSEDGSLAQRMRSQTTVEVLEEDTELGLMTRMVEVVRTHDPDILTGYEVHGSSWGYLIERARFKYDYDLCDEFARVKSESHGRSGREVDRWGFNTTSSIRVTGRHMVNIWRAMRGELNLLQYTMENVVWHLLHRRIPHYPWSWLTNWYTNGRHGDLRKVLRHYLRRTQLDVEILEANELIARTSEQARVLGVDFFSVFSRGSQFKVESIMFRIAKPENFMLVSPSRKQVGGQNALECLPLVMEPQSAFYSSPLVVLDFQSLYPSIMIAYNYCYSTFLGRVVSWRGTNKMGFAEYKRQEGLLGLLRDHVNLAPNGVMYVRSEIRKSLLAKMLIEILETRVMVKDGMKQDRDDKTLQRLLNNRQLALKLLANVTYGYTSASFSGRMPCSEIADSIVQTGRETLERAIAYIHSVERWGAEVVYGDTDSLFVALKGRTRAEAFSIGQEMAKAVTDMNPRPVKLKFEKVYHPCLLLAKKRYVGNKYESPAQTVPEFDAKGIETVRRDGTPAEQKMEEKALKLLFETADLSQVKEYFQAQCAKVLRGAVSVQDFCFAREVKLGTYASGNGAPPPPGALISTRRMLVDARAEPQYGERVPYVVIAGAPGARLIDRCVAPEDLLNNAHCELDANYYLTKNLIPPLERIFNLVGANVRAWYEEMPKVQRIRRVEAAAKNDKADASTGDNNQAGGGPNAAGPAGRKATLESYMRSASCIVCGVKMKRPAAAAETDAAICRACQRNAATSMFRLRMRLSASERRCADTLKVCQSCAGMAPLDDVPCDSKDCPVFYTRVKDATRLRTERVAMEPVLARLAELELGRDALEW